MDAQKATPSWPAESLASASWAGRLIPPHYSISTQTKTIGESFIAIVTLALLGFLKQQLKHKKQISSSPRNLSCLSSSFWHFWYSQNMHQCFSYSSAIVLPFGISTGRRSGCTSFLAQRFQIILLSLLIMSMSAHRRNAGFQVEVSASSQGTLSSTRLPAISSGSWTCQTTCRPTEQPTQLPPCGPQLVIMK